MSVPQDPQDELLRDALRQWEQEQERLAPPFRRMWRAAEFARRGCPELSWRMRPARVLAGLMLLATIGVSYLLLRPGSERPRVAAVESAKDEESLTRGWILPTDRLLEAPGTISPASLRRLTREIEALSSP